MSTINKFIVLNRNIIFLEFFRLLSISLFGIILIIYNFGDYSKLDRIGGKLDFGLLYPYFAVATFAYLYFRNKERILQQKNDTNLHTEEKLFSLIYFELVFVLVINVMIMSGFRSENSFIYFSQ